MSDLASRRSEYETAGIDASAVDPDPLVQWQRWYAEADQAGCAEPNAMVLSTVDEHGTPRSRAVLVRAADERGFVFYTNLESRKSREMAAHPVAAGLFPWLALHRQVRVTGTVEQVSADESDRYFASRPRASQIAAWASPQSQVIPDRAWLEQRVAQLETTFDGVDPVPRPAFWGGWLLRPDEVELWQGRRNRLHDRLRYRRDEAGGWSLERLAP